jgi:hypothetical protein
MPHGNLVVIGLPFISVFGVVDDDLGKMFTTTYS